MSELADVWQALPNKWLFFGLLVPWILLFHLFGNATFGHTKTVSLFEWAAFVYGESEDDGHCGFIPVIVLILFWWKRDELRLVAKKEWWPGAVVLAFAGLLHIVGFLSQQTRISIVAFFVGIYGLMGLAWGWKFLKASFFPFFLLAFCVPLGAVSESLTFPLRMLVSQIATWVGHNILGIDVVRVGTQIFNEQQTFRYDVAAACSGIRSLTILLALNTIFAFVAFQSTWRRLFTISLAAPLAILGNTLRIIGVIIAAELYGHDAGAKIETNLGFLTFGLALVALFAVSRILREKPESQPAEPVPTPEGQIA